LSNNINLRKKVMMGLVMDYGTWHGNLIITTLTSIILFWKRKLNSWPHQRGTNNRETVVSRIYVDGVLVCRSVFFIIFQLWNFNIDTLLGIENVNEEGLGMSLFLKKKRYLFLFPSRVFLVQSRVFKGRASQYFKYKLNGPAYTLYSACCGLSILVTVWPHYR